MQGSDRLCRAAPPPSHVSDWRCGAPPPSLLVGGAERDNSDGAGGVAPESSAGRVHRRFEVHERGAGVTGWLYGPLALSQGWFVILLMQPVGGEGI